MSYGVTSDGFVIKRLPDIKKELESDFTSAFGEIVLEEDSVAGQMIGIFSKRESDLWEELERIYLSKYPNSASGISLDYSVQYNAINRLPATGSMGIIIVCGEVGTTVPNNFKVSVVGTGKVFKTTQEDVIGSENVYEVGVGILSVVDNEEYSLSIDQTTISYTSDVDATEEEILEGLRDAVSSHVESAEIADDMLIIKNEDSRFSLSIVDSKTQLEYSSVDVPVVSEELGSIEAPINTLRDIVTPVAGIDKTYNIEAVTRGRDVETDSALRMRRKASIKSQGKGNLDAIQARMTEEIDGVTLTRVFENDSDSTDEYNRPQHSIEAIVAGGSDIDIANKLWELKAGGIKTYGNTSQIITDSQGFQRTIYFSRPVEKYVWVKFSSIVYDPEVSFPADGFSRVKQAVVDYGSKNFTLGRDLIRQMFYGPLYTIEGIASADVEIAITDSETGSPDYTSDAFIVIDPSELAVFDEDRVIFS